MAVSGARKRANSKWDKDNMATLGCKTKREDVEAFKQLAASQGKTANTLLRDYVLSCLAARAGENVTPDAVSERPRKLFTVVAGVEGSGKSSFLGSQLDRTPFGWIVDADKLSQNEHSPEEAMQTIHSKLHQCITKGIDFTLEIHSCPKEICKTAKLARERGYIVRLFYLGLDNVYETMERIAARARRGGIDVPAAVVRRHHAERFQMLAEFLPYCSQAVFYDNTYGFRQVGEYRNGQVLALGERQPLWILELIRTLQDYEI